MASPPKDDGHLPHLSHRREQKQLPASDFPRLEFAGKRSPYGALHYGRQGAAYRSKAADVEKISMDPSDQGGSDAHVRAAQKPRSHHADDAGVNDCALNWHPDIGGANADHAKIRESQSRLRNVCFSSSRRALTGGRLVSMVAIRTRSPILRSRLKSMLSAIIRSHQAAPDLPWHSPSRLPVP